jgi:hypothetical protein
MIVHIRLLKVLVIAAGSAIACADRADSPSTNTAESPDRPTVLSETRESAWRVVAVKDASDESNPGDASSHIIFESGDTLVVPLIHMEILSTLSAGAGAPWIVASGVECSFCDAPKMVVFLRAARGHADKPLRAYAFPGEQLQGGADEGPALLRNRMFVGVCAGRDPGAVIFHEEPDSAGSWTRSVRMISLSEAFADSAVVWNESIEERVAESVRSGECKEIPGEKQYVL